MPTQRYTAAWALPVTGRAVADAEVIVADGLILEVRPRRHDGHPVSDATRLGEAVIMPGLVNAHTHLDYTLFRGLLDNLRFFTWVRELTNRRAILDRDEWIASATIGAAEAAVAGITTVGDCTATGAAAIGAATVGLRGRIYQEVFGIDEAVSVDDAVRAALADVKRLAHQAAGSRLQIGLSPHAIYTVRPALLRGIAAAAADRELHLCSHASESVAEGELSLAGTGPIAARLAERGIDWPTPGCTPVQHLERHGVLGKRTLLVHGVHASSSDYAAVTQSGAAWVHCPKSNAKLANGIAPLRHLARMCGGRLGLGTDSVASNNGMDLFEEARFALLLQRAATRDENSLTAGEALEMATLGGARALGLEAEIGSLEPGKRADLAVMRLSGIQHAPVHDATSAVIYAGSGRDIILTLVEGEPVARRGRPTTAGVPQARRRVIRAAARLRSWSPA